MLVVVTTVMALAAITTTMLMFGTKGLMAQVLELDPPNQNGSETRQVTIRPNDHTFLFSSNKTAVIHIGGMAEDVDFKETPPPGISVVIDNKSVTVTKLPVGIPAAFANAGSDLPTPTIPAPAVTSDTSNSNDDSGGDSGGDEDGDDGDED
jgi:hypothetical protein